MATAEAPELVSTMGAEGAHHKDFVEWAQRVRGVQVDGVEPASFPGAGIGIVANRKITAGQAIVFVPVSSLVTVNPDARRKESQGPGSIHGRLALSLVEASDTLHETTNLMPWMRAMPNQVDVFSGMPIRWPSTFHSFLPPGAQTILENQKKNYERDMSAFRSFLITKTPRPSEDATQIAEEAYSHAWLLVNSRSFYWDYPKSGSSSSSQNKHKSKAARKRPRDDCMALCPFIDYFNHVSGTACAQVEYNITGFTVRSDRDYEAGEEVNVSYGAHSNDFLMVEYGFVMREDQNEDDWTPLDEFVLPLLNTEQKLRLEENGLLGKYVLDGNGNVCHRTQCALRALFLPLRKWERFVAGADDGEKDQSTANKLLSEKVLEKYARVAEAMRQQLVDLDKSYAKDMLLARWHQIGEMVRKGQDRA